jgi:hypothetical protein
MVDGSLALAGILAAEMVSVAILKGSVPGEVPVLGSAGKESDLVKKAA